MMPAHMPLPRAAWASWWSVDARSALPAWGGHSSGRLLFFQKWFMYILNERILSLLVPSGVAVAVYQAELV